MASIIILILFSLACGFTNIQGDTAYSADVASLNNELHHLTSNISLLESKFGTSAATVSSLQLPNSNMCKFPALFNFGDSNSDTGGAFVYFNNVHWPNGITIGKESKRFSDGRLIIDFLAETLNLPYLNASADTNGTSFQYGANFAVAGSCINPAGGNDTSQASFYHLDEQISRFLDFKAASIASKEEGMYPKPLAFPEALYTIDIGQNDVHGNFGSQPLSTILDFFTNSVKRLLNDGAKYLWVHNTCPLGCLPYFVQPYGGGKVCVESINNMSRNFNSELKLRIDLLRNQYPIAVITLVDMYSAKYQLIVNPPQGFDDALKFNYCCGTLFKPGCGCGDVNGKKACTDPSRYLSWEGVHWTQAANRVLANQVAGGFFSQPAGTELVRACYK